MNEYLDNPFWVVLVIAVIAVFVKGVTLFSNVYDTWPKSKKRAFKWSALVGYVLILTAALTWVEIFPNG